VFASARRDKEYRGRALSVTDPECSVPMKGGVSGLVPLTAAGDDTRVSWTFVSPLLLCAISASGVRRTRGACCSYPAAASV
jgi:hypothetical protein